MLRGRREAIEWAPRKHGLSLTRAWSSLSSYDERAAAEERRAGWCYGLRLTWTDESPSSWSALLTSFDFLIYL